MTTTTQNLGLFKYDTLLDAELPFNINEALNDNWDIIDETLANPIPTKTSQLTNDSGFLTQHQDLSAYAKAASPTLTGTVKVPASTTAGTALQLAAQSTGANGYIKFGSGIKIMWGSVALTGGTAKTITLPTSFSSKNYKVASGIDTTNQSGNEQNWIQISSINTGSFVLKRCDSGTNHWIAAGY